MPFANKKENAFSILSNAILNLSKMCPLKEYLVFFLVESPF